MPAQHHVSLSIEGITEKVSKEVEKLFEVEHLADPFFCCGRLVMTFVSDTFSAETPKEWGARIEKELRERFKNPSLKLQIDSILL